MKLSRTVSYAIAALLQLSQSTESGPVSCSRLAAVGGMPGRFLLQVLRNLVVHGVLRSDLGVDGGYTLNRPLDSISLLEVIEAIEGPIAASVPTTLSLPAESYIRLRTALDHVARLKRAALQNVSLACLLPDYLDKVS